MVDVRDGLVDARRPRAPPGWRRDIRCANPPRSPARPRDRARARHRRRAISQPAACRSARIGGSMVAATARSTSKVSVAPHTPVRRILAFSTIVARLLRIGRGVDIDVADAFEMRDHRHAAFALHPLDQRAPAARHDHVDLIAHASIMPTAARSRGRHQLHRRLRAGRRLRARLAGKRRSRARNGSSPSRRAGSRRCRRGVHSPPASAVTLGRDS